MEDSRTLAARMLIAIPAAALLAFAGWTGLRWGLGSVQTWYATGAVISLSGKSRPEPGDLARQEQALERLARAEALRGRHPEQYDDRGQLLYWQAIHFEEPGPARGAVLEQAAEQFRLALAMRPTWPYFWANLALAKAEAGVFDDEFRRAIQRAVETGPWERQVQLQLIRLDFVEGGRVDEQSRRYIETLLANAVRSQPMQVLALADTREQMMRICAHIDDPRLEGRCAPFRPHRPEPEQT